MILNLFLYLLLFLVILISVAFVTLLERKILGYVQNRKGPNKVGYLGIFQPLSDALKLFSKENNFMNLFNMMIFLFTPFLSLFLMLLFWILYLWVESLNFIFNDFIFIFFISSMSVYVILGSGWSSNSKYALLGAYRGIAQTISYEVCFSFIILGILVILNNYSLKNLGSYQKNMSFFVFFFELFIFWLIIILAETNRSPFDFSEGESELVSGFNVEYGSLTFAVLFMAEYGNIIFFSYLTTILFWGSSGGSFLFIFNFIIIFFLWIRGTLVRFRYDNLMMMSWKILLPFSLFMLMLIFFINFLNI